MKGLIPEAALGAGAATRDPIARAASIVSLVALAALGIWAAGGFFERGEHARGVLDLCAGFGLILFAIGRVKQ